MLRRSFKRAVENQENKHEKENRTKGTTEKRFRPLGDDHADKEESEEVLEKLVLGGERMIVERLVGRSTEDKDTSVRSEEEALQRLRKERKPAWVDEDDDRVTVAFSTKKHREIIKPNEKELSGPKLHQRLKSQFEKTVGGAPSWAKLKSERDEEDVSGDEEDRELLASTGDYLTTSDKLAKETLEIKRCTNANSEKPTRGRVSNVEFHPGAQVILTSGYDQSLNLFQVDGRTNPKIQSVFMEKFPIYMAHFSADGEQVIMSSQKRFFHVYDMIAGKVMKIPDIMGIEEPHLQRFEVSPDGKYLVFLGSYGYIYIISAKSREWTGTLKMNGSVEKVAFSDDGIKLYAHGADGDVYIWDLRSQRCLNKFTDDGCIRGTSIAVSGHEQYIACGSQSGVVNIYDSSSCLSRNNPEPLKRLMNLTTPVTDAKFNSTNEILAVSSNFTDDALKLIHFPSMTVFSNFPGLNNSLKTPTCLDFSPQSGYLAIGNNKGNVLLYRLKHYTET